MNSLVTISLGFLHVFAIFLNLVKKDKSKKEGLESERNLHLLIVFCWWQNCQRKFFKKQNLNRIYGGGVLMIDDIFFLWGHGEEKLKPSIDSINKLHPSIKFKEDLSKTLINFLDVAVSLANGVIETDLYVKHTDSREYLLSSSCHPCYCKKGIQYSQVLRLNR